MNEKDTHVHDENCGCDHHHDTVTLILEDGSEMACPIIDIFEIEEQKYIALLHPVDETALLYRFFDHEDGRIEVDSIESDEEFEKVAEYMNKLMDELQEDE